MNAILILALVVSGQCGPRGCPLPAAVVNYEPVTVQPAKVEGRDYYVFQIFGVHHDGLTFDVKGYMKDGKVTWHPSEPYNAASWAAAKAAAKKPIVPAVRPEKPPTAVPGPAPKKGATAVDTVTRPFKGLPFEQIENYGMEPGRMGSRTTYHAPSPEAKRFIQEAKTEAASPGKIHVTVIGSDDNRAPVVNDLLTHPAFAALKPTMMVQDYTPNEWPVDPSLGFVTNGKPTIIVQTAKGPNDPKGGRVVYRASDYSMGPEALAEAVRKADPNYKPANDPTPNQGPTSASSCPLGFTRDHWPLILAVGIGLVFLNRLPRKGV